MTNPIVPRPKPVVNTPIRFANEHHADADARMGRVFPAQLEVPGAGGVGGGATRTDSSEETRIAIFQSGKR